MDNADQIRSFSRDKTSGAFVYVNYQGVVDITPELKLILEGSPDAKTTDFGGSCKCDDVFKLLVTVKAQVSG